MPTTIADILRGLGEIPPSDVALVEEARPESPVPLATPWVKREKIAAANARDVVERNNDDRSYAMKSALGSHFAAVVRAVHKTKRIVKPKAAPKPKVKKERTPELREYFREYQRKLRAKRKAEAFASPPQTNLTAAVADTPAARL